MFQLFGGHDAPGGRTEIIFKAIGNHHDTVTARPLGRLDDEIPMGLHHPVQGAIDQGRDVLFDIDWQGAQQIQNSALGPHTLSIFLLPPSITELRRRLEARGQDTADTIAKRMQKSWDEISHWGSYDFVLVNGDLDDTEARLKSIVAAARLRRSQQPGLTAHVRNLQSEFEEGDYDPV